MWHCAWSSHWNVAVVLAAVSCLSTEYDIPSVYLPPSSDWLTYRHSTTSQAHTLYPSVTDWLIDTLQCPKHIPITFQWLTDWLIDRVRRPKRIPCTLQWLTDLSTEYDVPSTYLVLRDTLTVLHSAQYSISLSNFLMLYKVLWMFPHTTWPQCSWHCECPY